MSKQQTTRTKQSFGGFATIVFGALACGIIDGLVAKWAGPEIGIAVFLPLVVFVGWKVLP